MPIQNIESLFEPVSADEPCGPDLENDAKNPAFNELERLLQGKAEQQMGDHIVPAQEPDWKEVGNRAIAMLGKTKNIRLAIWLTRARLSTEGFAGIADGLQVTRGIIEKFWDGVYPKLEDNEDPIRRNAFMDLSDGPTFIDRLRMIPLVSSRSLGRFSLRDIAIATGELAPPAGSEPPKMAAIDGAFTECPLPELQATADRVHSALESLAAIEAVFTDKVGAAMSPDFGPLIRVLQTAEKLLAQHLARRGIVTEAAAGGAEGGAEGGGGGGGGPGGPSISGEINSREDVIRVLDKICFYYQRCEPSSPIPLLLQRSKRLVSASFMDIVRDLAPDGVAQIENLRGKDESESS